MNPANASAQVSCIENSEKAEEVSGATIVNVDANFLIPEEEQGVDLAFPRLRQMHAMARVALKNKSLVPFDAIPSSDIGSRPYREPDYAEEWKALRKAWTLARNDQKKIVAVRVKEASKEYYRSEPLDSFQDWLWRFSLFVGQPGYEPQFVGLAEELKKPTRSKLADFAHYFSGKASERGMRYLTTFSEFFANYSEFSQVFFFVVRGLPLPEGKASSVNFDAVRMFYGNAFEQFTALIDYLALANNVLLGRAFNEFEKLKFEDYYKLDKSSRSGPIQANAAFVKICMEADNQFRNASHHGSLEFDTGTQMIRYRAGKGGSGEEQAISYVEYLAKCTRLFLQLITLFRLELLTAYRLSSRPPV